MKRADSLLALHILPQYEEILMAVVTAVGFLFLFWLVLTVHQQSDTQRHGVLFAGIYEVK